MNDRAALQRRLGLAHARLARSSAILERLGHVDRNVAVVPRLVAALFALGIAALLLQIGAELRPSDALTDRINLRDTLRAELDRARARAREAHADRPR